MKNKGFNLISIIIIILVTSVVSGITTGIILDNNYKNESGLTYSEVANDEHLSEFINIYSTVLDEYYDDIDKEKMMEAALEGMLNYLGDSYTTFLSDEESSLLQEKLEGTYEGIGIVINGSRVDSVKTNSPAQEAGILPNDIIINIDGTVINETNAGLIANLIKDNNNETVNIIVKRGEEEKTFNIKKELLDSSITGKKITDTNIGYINVSVFSENIGDSFKETLLDLEKQNIDSLIIDLRSNTGGYLDGATDIASLFLDKGKTIYSLEDKDGNIVTKDETSEKRDYEIIILQNQDSASASEILAAALVDSYGASIVGTKSFGKGKVQQTLSTSTGSIAKYTSSKWYTPNGICIDGIGIEPTYFVEQEVIYEGDVIVDIIDSQLNKAVELLNK